MPQTFAAADAVELAVVERSGFVESRHTGIAIVLAADGTVAAQLGDPSSLVLPRSSLKPLQALACLTAGAPLDGERLGLATASHSGTDRHVAVVRDILDAAGLGEDALGCPPAWPGDTATRDELVREHAEPSRIRMNCSGKHAAMLLTCVTNGWSTDGYLDPEHPLQLHIREVVERLIGEKTAATADRRLRCAGVRDDACSASPARSIASATRRRRRRSPCTAAPACWCRPCARTRGPSTVPADPTPS